MLTLGAAVVVLAAVCVWQWRRYRKTVKKVVFLFDALDNGDYTFRFPEKGKYDDDKLMNASLNRVKEILRHARDEQIEREKYFELIIDSVDTGILVLDDGRGVVLRCNKAALKLLQMEVVTHVNQIKDRLESLSVRDAYTTLKWRRVRIVAISDIKGELANQEIDSWVKLIRVLTHEIMNTITPIVSLSEVMLTQAEGGRKAELEVINRTSKELVRFVENYRKFTHVPTPVPQLFYVKPFLERMARLAEQRMKPGCTVGVDVSPEDLLVYADEGLIGRVVSNLLKNAVEAVGGEEACRLCGLLDGGRQRKDAAGSDNGDHGGEHDLAALDAHPVTEAGDQGTDDRVARDGARDEVGKQHGQDDVDGVGLRE